ncbi:hypothetical protein [Vibrio anguillarum]|uniref:hypothetical protein n=1 Tax=Vibrio anguillarum TaxID=55601 RepID=UPI00031DDFE6|nr:hypothetical protein [Vibrio anguillarum]
MITIVNDIDWWTISLLNFMNSWLPGIFTFFLGFLFEKWSSRRKLKTELKNNLLEIFIPTFNSGENITIDLAKSTNFKLKATLNAYKRIYPKTFDEKAVEELSQIFADGFIVDDEVNQNYLAPEKVQDLIRRL